MITLRPYQEEAKEAVRARLAHDPTTAVILPTGTGKTTVFADFGREWVERNDGGRVLYLAHRDELIDQAAKRLRLMTQHDRAQHTVGIVQGDLNQTRARHVVGSVGTLRNELRRRMLADVSLIICDEAHHAAADSYVKIFNHYGVGSQGGAKAIGFTATMMRSDRKSLRMWRSIAYEKSIQWAIREGYLVPPVGVRVRVEDLALSQPRGRGDISEKAAGEAITHSMAPEKIAEALCEHAPDRPTIVFLPTVDAARMVQESIDRAGFTTGLIYGDLAKEIRKKRLSDYAAGKIQVLVNVMVLTEGTDLPRTSCIVIGRPTRSVALYQQMVGRGLRLLAEAGKRDCLVLDMVGAIPLGLASCTDLLGQDGDEDETNRTPCVCTSAGECVHVQCHDECQCSRPCVCSKSVGEPEPTVAEEPIWPDGPLVSEIVPMFDESPVMWMRTARQVPFLPAGERYIAIVPGDPERGGGYDVVAVHWSDWDQARYVVRGCTDFASAMMYAQDDMTKAETRAASRDDGFRKRRVWATEEQKAMGRRYGVDVDRFKYASELQIVTTEAVASHRIDTCLPPWIGVS